MKLLSAAEAASRMGLSQREVQRLCQAGLLRSQSVGGRYLITEKDADRYIPAQRGRPKKETEG